MAGIDNRVRVAVSGGVKDYSDDPKEWTQGKIKNRYNQNSNIAYVDDITRKQIKGPKKFDLLVLGKSEDKEVISGGSKKLQHALYKGIEVLYIHDDSYFRSVENFLSKNYDSDPATFTGTKCSDCLDFDAKIHQRSIRKK